MLNAAWKMKIGREKEREKIKTIITIHFTIVYCVDTKHQVIFKIFSMGYEINS